MSNNQEIKHMLRKMDFPESATEALKKIALLVCGRVPSIKSMDLANELIAEFIFCEVDSKQRPRTHPTPYLSPIKELQLVDTLINFLHNMNGSEAAKNTMFLFVFPVSNMAVCTIRMAVLTKMVSVSAALPSQVILRAASVAMQQIGTNSELSSAVCETIVRDYCELSGGRVLGQLPELVPPFAANLLTAISDMYLQTSNQRLPVAVSLSHLKQPPKALLGTITDWVASDPRLCVAAHSATPALPPGAIAMEATTPIAGLLRWCVLAPLLPNVDVAIYGRLHLALLYSMLEADTGRAVSAQDLAAPISVLAAKAEECEGGDDSLQIALDRLAQAVQVALSSRCVYGNVDDLVNQLSEVKCGNRLVGIVVGEYKQRKESIITI